MSAKKMTLKDGIQSVYPQTTDDVVFFEKKNNKTLRKVIEDIEENYYTKEEAEGYVDNEIAGIIQRMDTQDASLDSSIVAMVTEYNISLHQKNMTTGSPRYDTSIFTLQEAIAQVPDDIKRGGLKLTFNSSSSNDSSLMDHVECYDLNSNVWTTNTGYWYRNDGKCNREEISQLGQTINGGSIVGYIEEIWTAKGYIQTQDAVIGSVWSPVIDTDYNSRAYIIKVKAGETYKINGLGDTSAVNLVVILDSNNIVLDKYMGDSRTNAYIANIEQDGILCVNLYSYNSATDGVYFARKNSGLDKDVENILGEQVPQNINIAPKGNGAIRTDTVVIDSAFTQEIVDVAGCVYFEFSAKKGDYINIKGSGDTEIVSLYVRCNTQGIAKEKYTGNLQGCNGYIRVEEDSIFYVNILNFDETTMGVTIHRYEYIGGIEDKIDGVNIDVVENIVPRYWSQGYVDTSNAVIGNKFHANHINQTSGIVGFIIDVKVGERYEIKGVGDTQLVSLYVLCDDLDIVLNKFTGNARKTPISIDIQKNGTLYINIIGYDASVDYIHKVKPTTIGGYKAYYESENNLKWKGKNIVCFGDSLTEFTESQRTGKRYTDYIEEKTGASVYNVGIGGTRIAQRGVPTSSPQSSTEAYAGLDICNMVKAWATRDFTIVDACAEYLKNNTGDDNTGIIDVLKSSHFENTDIVTIFAGTNDYTGDSVIGSSTDKDDGTDNGNMWGALKYIIKEILTANPKIHIYVFSPIVRYIGNIQEENWSDNYTRGDGRHLYDIADIISDISKYKHIPCCNWYWNLGWNQDNFALYFMNAFGIVDDTHPVSGFGYIADKMIGFLKSNGE